MSHDLSPEQKTASVPTVPVFVDEKSEKAEKEEKVGGGEGVSFQTDQKFRPRISPLSDSSLSPVSLSPSSSAERTPILLFPQPIQCLVWVPSEHSEEKKKEQSEEKKKEQSEEKQKEIDALELKEATGFWRDAKRSWTINVEQKQVTLNAPIEEDSKAMLSIGEEGVFYPSEQKSNKLFAEKLDALIRQNFFPEAKEFTRSQLLEYAAIRRSIIRQLRVYRSQSQWLDVAAFEWARDHRAVNFGLQDDPRCSHLMYYEGYSDEVKRGTLRQEVVINRFEQVINAFIRFKILGVATLDEKLSEENQKKYDDKRSWIIQRFGVPPFEGDASIVGSKYFSQRENNSLYLKRLNGGGSTILTFDYDPNKGIIARRVTPVVITASIDFDSRISEQRKLTRNAAIIINEDSENAPPLAVFQVFGVEPLPDEPFVAEMAKIDGWMAVDPTSEQKITSNQQIWLSWVTGRIAQTYPRIWEALTLGRNYPDNFERIVSSPGFLNQFTQEELLALDLNTAIMKFRFEQAPLAVKRGYNYPIGFEQIVASKEFNQLYMRSLSLLAINAAIVRSRFAAAYPQAFNAIVTGRDIPADFAESVNQFYHKLNPAEQDVSANDFQRDLDKAWNALPTSTRFNKSLSDRAAGRALIAFLLLAITTFVIGFFPEAIPALGGFAKLIGLAIAAFDFLIFGTRIFTTPQPQYDITTMTKLKGPARIASEPSSASVSPSLSPHHPNVPPDLNSIATTTVGLDSQQSRVSPTGSSGHPSPNSTPLRSGTGNERLDDNRPKHLQSALFQPQAEQVVHVSPHSADRGSPSGDVIQESKSDENLANRQHSPELKVSGT